MMQETRISKSAIQRLNQDGSGLFVEIWKSADRFQHVIGSVENNQRSEWMTSLESGPDEIWPISPAIQQVYQQKIQQDPVLLGVGMAGTSHYSVSLLLKQADTRSPQLVVEAACSVNKNVESVPKLSSTYRINPEMGLQINQDQLVLTREKTEVCMQALPNTKLSIEQNQRVVLSPVESDQRTTTQWGYIIEINKCQTVSS